MIEVKEHLKLENIIGKTISYSRVYCDDGYSMYDVAEPFENRNYLTDIKTLSKDVNQLAQQYEVVEGNAAELNEIHMKEVEKIMSESEV